MTVAAVPSLVGRLAARAADSPDSPLIEEWTADGELVSLLTTAEVWGRSVALGGALRALVPPGSTVALLVEPGADAVVAQCATSWAGGTFVPLNPSATGPELERDVGTARCALAIVDGSADPVQCDALARATGRPVMDIRDLAEAAPVTLSAQARDPAAIVFTSGSTAAPRGALFTHGALTRAADESVELFGFTDEDRLLCNLPLHHVAANVSLVWPAITTGATLVIVPFSAGRFFELASACGVTFGIINATHIRMIEARGAQSVPHRLRRAATGFSLAAERLRAFEERFGIEMLNGYGFTEALGHVTSQRLGRSRTPGGAGWPIGGRGVAILDEEGKSLPPGSIGEISVTWTSPDEVMVAYVGDPEGTRGFIGTGIIRTGDLGYLGQDGELFFADRIKDVMKRGGVTVSPAEIEAVVATYPGVEECAVIAAPSDVYGEEPVAVVVPSPGTDPDVLVEAVLELCASRLERHKVPAAVVVVDALPRLTIGKVDKRALRQQVGLAVPPPSS